jgi:hypothetical protein
VRFESRDLFLGAFLAERDFLEATFLLHLPGHLLFLEAGYHQGVNTIGSSLKNASRDLRAEPINPQQVVSPWMQSTVEPDLTRRPLEDGEQA